MNLTMLLEFANSLRSIYYSLFYLNKITKTFVQVKIADIL